MPENVQTQTTMENVEFNKMFSDKTAIENVEENNVHDKNE